MYNELLQRSLSGDRIARSQLYLQLLLFPKLEKMFRKLGLESDYLIFPDPFPGATSVEWGKVLGEKAIFDSLSQAPSFSDTLIPEDVKGEVSQKLLSSLSDLMGELEE